MKKSLVIIMSLVFFVFVTGCSSEKKEEVSSNVKTETKAENQEPKAEEKKEEVKQEEPKKEENKQEETKKEETKAENKQEEVKQEEPKKEEPKKEEVKEQAKKEEIKKEEPKNQEVKVSQETAKTTEKAQETKAVNPEPKKEEEKKEEVKVEAPKTVYKDGTYSGTAKGYSGDITVSVTIANDKITAVSVTNTIDDEPYISQAKELTATIVANNSASVSVVSGATISSNGIINAVNNALSKAKN